MTVNKRFTEERDVRNKLLGSVVYSPKKEEYFCVSEYLGRGLVKVFDFSQDKWKYTSLNIEDPEDLSLRNFCPGYINKDNLTTFWTKSPRKSWCYGYHANHAITVNRVNRDVYGLNGFSFSRIVTSPEGHAALHGMYPDIDEALWIAERDDPFFSEDIALRAFSKHLAFAKLLKTGDISICMDGIPIGTLNKEKRELKIKTRVKRISASLFKDIFSCLPFEPHVKTLAPLALEGDEPDYEEYRENMGRRERGIPRGIRLEDFPLHTMPVEGTL